MTAPLRFEDGVLRILDQTRLPAEEDWLTCESPEQVVQVGQQVRVKVVDVDVSRRRISLSIRRVGDEPEVLPEAEIFAEDTESLSADIVPEPSPETREALQDAEARADEGSEEAFEAYMEPEPESPEESAMHMVPEPDVAAPPAAAEEGEGDVTLESILEDLKRREGRS